MVGGEIDEVIAVGEELRPAMCAVLRGVQRGRFDRRSPGDRNLEKRAPDVRSEDDDAFGAPRTASRIRGIADRQRSAAGDIESTEFASREEGQLAAVGRPEREGTVLSLFDGM